MISRRRRPDPLAPFRREMHGEEHAAIRDRAADHIATRRRCATAWNPAVGCTEYVRAGAARPASCVSRSSAITDLRAPESDVAPWWPAGQPISSSPQATTTTQPARQPRSTPTSGSTITTSSAPTRARTARVPSTNSFLPSLGNHDWGTPNAQPYLDYFALPGNERYYDHVQGPVHFFIVDSDPNEPDGIDETVHPGGLAAGGSGGLQLAVEDRRACTTRPYSSSSVSRLHADAAVAVQGVGRGRGHRRTRPHLRTAAHRWHSILRERAGRQAHDLSRLARPFRAAWCATTRITARCWWMPPATSIDFRFITQRRQRRSTALK